MFLKVLAGVMAVAVLSGGSYAYWHYSHGCGAVTEECCPSATTSTISVPAPCCQEPTRAECCSKIPTSSECCEGCQPEVLAIQPREVK